MWYPTPTYTSASPLTPNVIKAILEYTAVPMRDELGYDYDWLTQGAGGVNAIGAIALAAALDTAVPDGHDWNVGPFDPYTSIGGETYAWASNIVWGVEHRLGQQHRLG